MRAKLSSSNPAAASRRTASATSITTSVRRRRRGTPPPRSSSFNACVSVAREVSSAGASPHRRLVSQRHAKSKEKRTRVECRRGECRDRGATRPQHGRGETREHVDAPDRARRPTHPCGGGEHQAFSEQLTHDARTPRTNRHPNRQFTPPHSPTRQEQARDVRAGDEQHASGGGEEQQYRAAERRFHASPADRLRNGAPARIIRVVPRGERRAGRGQLCVGLIQRHPILEPRNDRNEELRGGQVLGIGETWSHRSRNPQQGFVAQPGEIRGHDADHRQRNIIHADRTTDDGRIRGVAIAPEAIAQQGDW